VEKIQDDLERDHGRHDGVAWDDLLRLPDRRFFRRKGEAAWAMVGVDGEVFDEADTYLRYLSTLLSDGYMASRDLKLYAEGLRKVVAGEWTPQDATKRLPKLRRVGGTCPCSRAVRWVVDEPAASAS
jgi:hypothetical protein